MTINENAGQQTVNLSGIAAGGGASETLMVTASSNDTALINPAVIYTSPDSTGTLTFTPATNNFGTATITVTVMESGGTQNGGVNQTQVQFTVTVNQVAVAATVTAVSANWGTSGTIALQTAGDGLRLLPAGRNTDLPWFGINKLQITLSQAESLSPSDVSVTGITVANYGPVTISGSGTNYTITLAQAITVADRVTLTIGNAGIATYTRRLDVLPGDFNDDGVVSSADMTLINNATAAPYNVFADIDGDGAVTISDVQLARKRIGTALPCLPQPVESIDPLARRERGRCPHCLASTRPLFMERSHAATTRLDKVSGLPHYHRCLRCPDHIGAGRHDRRGRGRHRPPGSSGNSFDVVLENTGTSAVTVAGFSFGLTSSSNVSSPT